ncbi:MAG: hypothetical protein COU27_01430, partial [Candidatus Levybacteria bacterium CG10_big_fil_rev_8_21_14_0_10_36_7]
SDMRYVARGGSWMFVSEIVSNLALALLALSYAHFLSPEVYGQYKFALAGLGLLSSFSLTGLSTSYMRSVAIGATNSLSSTLLVGMKWSIFSAFLAGLVSGYYFFQGNTFLGTAFAFTALFLPFFSNFSIYDSFLLGKKKFSAQTKYRVLRIILSTTILIAGIIIFNNPLVIFLIYLFSTTLISALFYFLVNRSVVEKKNDFDPEMVPYAKHLTAMSIFSRLISHVDEILAFHFLGPAQLAVYAFAIALPRQVKSFNGIINNLIFPKLTEKTLPELRKILPFKIFIFTAFLAVLNFFYILLAPFVYSLFFPQYIDAVAYSQVFSLTITIAGPMLFLSELLVTHKKSKELYILRFITPITKLTLLFFLVPRFGIWGAVWSLLIGDVVNLIILLYFFFQIKNTR